MSKRCESYLAPCDNFSDSLYRVLASLGGVRMVADRTLCASCVLAGLEHGDTITLVGAPRERLVLKFGDLKAWHFEAPESIQAFVQYVTTLGLTHDQREALCHLIDVAHVSAIVSDWDGKEFTKDEAKDYVRKYGKERSRIHGA